MKLLPALLLKLKSRPEVRGLYPIFSVINSILLKEAS
jgi:hypothetical protein